MTEKIVNGSAVKYSLMYMDKDDITRLVQCETKHHEFIGYILLNSSGEYVFYSVEDDYKHPIMNHWTSPIVKNYDNHECWLLVKEHPCHIYNIMTDIYKGNHVYNLNNFDTWKTDAKDCLVGVITDMEID